MEIRRVALMHPVKRQWVCSLHDDSAILVLAHVASRFKWVYLADCGKTLCGAARPYARTRTHFFFVLSHSVILNSTSLLFPRAIFFSLFYHTTTTFSYNFFQRKNNYPFEELKLKKNVFFSHIFLHVFFPWKINYKCRVICWN